MYWTQCLTTPVDILVIDLPMVDCGCFQILSLKPNIMTDSTKSIDSVKLVRALKNMPYTITIEYAHKPNNQANVFKLNTSDERKSPQN